MKIAITIILCFTCFSLDAQTNNSKNKIHVSNPKGKVTISPDLNTLFTYKPNLIKITISNGKQIDHVTLSGGTITGTDSFYKAKVIGGKEAILQVYEKMSEGNSRLIFVKRYAVEILPRAVIDIDGVKNDSTIEKILLLAIGRVHVRLGATSLKINSFEMQFNGSGIIDTLRTEGNRLDKAMRRKADELKGGSSVLFDKIKCQMPDSTEKVFGPMRIYISERSVRGFGL